MLKKPLIVVAILYIYFSTFLCNNVELIASLKNERIVFVYNATTLPLLKFQPLQDDFYYTKLDDTINEANIYSLFSNLTICSFTYEPNEYIARCYLHDDKLVVYYDHFPFDNQYIKLYRISNKSANLSSMTPAGIFSSSWDFEVINDKLFAPIGISSNFALTIVCDIIGYDIGFTAGQLADMLIRGYVRTGQQNKYVFHQGLGMLSVNDAHDFTVSNASLILQNAKLSAVYDENYFIVEGSLQRDRIYHYDNKSNIISHSFDIPNTFSDYKINCHNNVITVQSGDISSYYSILNNKFVKIGEKRFPNRLILSTYFYPELKKMLQVTDHEIFMFDVEYSVSESDVVTVTGKTSLSGNYPNPFNPTTTIKFIIHDLEDAQNPPHFKGNIYHHVTINIYNIKGQKVRSLVDDTYPLGEHSVLFNGCDDNGVTVPSGIYFYQLSVGEFNEIKKMVLVK